MFKVYIHTTMFSENVRKIIDRMLEDSNQTIHPYGYVCLVANGQADVLKTLIFRASVAINNDVVWKTPVKDSLHHNVDGTPELSYESFKNRVSMFYDVENEVEFRNYLSAYCPRHEPSQYHGHDNIQQLSMAYGQSMLGNQHIFDDFDDVLLTEDGTSKSSDGHVMLSPRLCSDLDGKDFMIIGGSLYAIKRVGSAYQFDFIPATKVLEM
ncbi:hypothetical protein MYOV003v1_p0036 [Vibrio phage 207E48.1]|nr:hypothetical protein MYOV003v1_p0036 [Vibrio phage 207E48.1]